MKVSTFVHFTFNLLHACGTKQKTSGMSESICENHLQIFHVLSVIIRRAVSLRRPCAKDKTEMTEFLDRTSLFPVLALGLGRFDKNCGASKRGRHFAIFGEI